MKSNKSKAFKEKFSWGKCIFNPKIKCNLVKWVCERCLSTGIRK